MKGNLQLCKADVCVKATGDFAETLLMLLGIGLIVAFIIAIIK